MLSTSSPTEWRFGPRFDSSAKTAMRGPLRSRLVAGVDDDGDASESSPSPLLQSKVQGLETLDRGEIFLRVCFRLLARRSSREGNGAMDGGSPPSAIPSTRPPA